MTTRINEAALIRDLSRPGGPVEQDVARRSIRVRNRAVELCTNRMVNIRTGRLASSITWSLERIGGIPVGVVGTNVEYAKWVHNGTGIYGPGRRPITPTHARVLRFKPPGARDYVFVRSVKGSKPRPFLTTAMKDVLDE